MEPIGTPEVKPLEMSGIEEPAMPSPPQKKGGGAWETLRSLLVILVGVFCIRIFVGEATVIPTGSMENTILVGDHVFLDKLPFGPQLPYTSLRLPRLERVHRGDIIAFHYPLNPSVMYVKRVMGVGGDVIRVVDDQVYRNGKRLTEPYVVYNPDTASEFSTNFPPAPNDTGGLTAEFGVDPTWARSMPKYIDADGLRVPRGYLFVMGDNRDNSSDSRFWGFVPVTNVVGEPLFVYWSYDAPSKDWMDESLEGRLRFDGSIIVNFVRNTRWSRIGKIFENPRKP
jgi:signal peptidase I